MLGWSNWPRRAASGILLAVHGQLLRWLDELVYATYKLGQEDFDLWLWCPVCRPSVELPAARPTCGSSRRDRCAGSRTAANRFQLANADLYGPRIGEYDVEQLAKERKNSKSNWPVASPLTPQRLLVPNRLPSQVPPAAGEVLLQFLSLATPAFRFSGDIAF